MISSLIEHSSWLDKSMGEFGQAFEPGEDFPAFNFSFARLKKRQVSGGGGRGKGEE